MQKLKCASMAVLSATLVGCVSPPSNTVLDGVPIEKVIAQIKADLAKTNIASRTISGTGVSACGASGKSFMLIRSKDTTKQPTVTVKLQSVDGTDGTASASVGKLPITPVVLFTANVSYEEKRLVTREQDITFNVLPEPIASDQKEMPENDMSEIGKEIFQAEKGVLHSDHGLKPCLQPTHLEVSITFDVTRTKEADSTVGFLLLYSIAGKESLSGEKKNQIVVDINYDKDTPPAAM